MTLEEIKPLIEEKLKFMRMELYDIKYIRAGKHSVLRIFIDKAGGVTIDDCERVSNEISMLLDVENFSDTPYTLEVSSPGADRPLITQKDFNNVIGHYVKVELKSENKPFPIYIGKCVSCTNNILLLDIDDDKEVKIPLEKINSARLDIRFK